MDEWAIKRWQADLTSVSGKGVMTDNSAATLNMKVTNV